MLRIFVLSAVAISCVLTMISVLSASYSLEPIALLIAIICIGLLGLSVWAMEHTRPVGKILPGRESAKVQRFRELRKLKPHHMRASLFLAIVWISVHTFLLFTERISLVPSTQELFQLGAGLGRSNAHGEIWRLVSGFFIHQSIAQLFCNVVGLLAIGRLLDYVLNWKNYVAVYFLGATAAAVINSILSPDQLLSYSSGALFAIYGGLLATVLFSNKLKKIDLPDFVFIGSAIQIMGSVSFGVQQFGENFVFLAASLACGFALTFVWFLSEKDRLMQTASLGAAALLLALFSLAALPRFISAPSFEILAKVNLSSPSRAPASAIQSVENTMWNKFEIYQQRIGESRWVKKAVLPTFDSLMVQTGKLRSVFMKKKTDTTVVVNQL